VTSRKVPSLSGSKQSIKGIPGNFWIPVIVTKWHPEALSRLEIVARWEVSGIEAFV
jgi:hypothetical protein